MCCTMAQTHPCMFCLHQGLPHAAQNAASPMTRPVKVTPIACAAHLTAEDVFLRSPCPAAAFVADVYNTSVQQGPTLPIATRSVLMGEYRSNSTRWRNRLLAALTQVQAFSGHLLPVTCCIDLSRA